MGRILGYIVLGIVALMVIMATLSLLGFLAGLLWGLFKILFRLAIFGAIVWFGWQVVERLRQRA